MTDLAHLAAIRALVERVAALWPETPEQIALVAFMTGALYALERAVELEFDDSRMKPNLATVPSELRNVLGALRRSNEPAKPWLSGFYAGSAMLRVDALSKRSGKTLSSPLVANAVNSMKHDVDAGIAKGWEVRLADVITAAQELCEHLEKSIPK